MRLMSGSANKTVELSNADSIDGDTRNSDKQRGLERLTFRESVATTSQVVSDVHSAGDGVSQNE